ncbi:MAG: pyridoxamine 5'-phosphate oxidase [Saprospiraceae bacterium]|nr:pyridoxamine 5'-phosphate oxidase [Saprospiraceae bacterium]
MDYKDLRKEYLKHRLDPASLHADPMIQFKLWFDEALQAKVDEPNAMVCASVSAEGKPSSRYVLLKELKEDQFIFFTNYHSRKGIELFETKFCSLVFYWRELERQIRIEGIAEKCSAAYSDEYFNSRPHGSKLSSIVSPQSSKIESKEYLESELKRISGMDASEIKRPEHWGGIGIRANYIEFWQGRQDRFHDRVCYAKTESGAWEISLLAP